MAQGFDGIKVRPVWDGLVLRRGYTTQPGVSTPGTPVHGGMP
jgi:hypothetical protein